MTLFSSNSHLMSHISTINTLSFLTKAILASFVRIVLISSMDLVWLFVPKEDNLSMVSVPLLASLKKCGMEPIVFSDALEEEPGISLQVNASAQTTSFGMEIPVFHVLLVKFGTII